jgi:hypothetical protein
MFGLPEKATTTPKEITKEIFELCAKIDPTQKPVFVNVVVKSNGRLDDCFENVRLLIAKEGGVARYGWTIWEQPEVLVEGEFHAVWQTPEGKLLDVTPKRDGENKILFLPDSKRVWQEEPIDNIRFPLKDTPAIRLMIRFNEASFALHKRYYTDGNSEIPQSEFQKVLAKFGLCPGHPAEIGKYDPCACGSGKKFKFCCADLTKRMS